MNIDFKETPATVSGKLEALEQCLVYLKSFDNPEKLIQSEKTYKILYLIRNILLDHSFSEKSTNYLKFIEHKTYNLFGNLLLYLSSTCEEIKFQGNEPDFEELYDLESINHKRIYILEYLCSILFSLIDTKEFDYFNRATFEFSIQFAINNGLRGLISFFKYDLFLQNQSEYVQNLIGRFLSRIKNLSEKEFDNDHIIWSKLKVIPILKRFKTLNTCKNHPEYLNFVDEVIHYLNQKPLQKNIQHLCEIRTPAALVFSLSAFKSLHYIYNSLKFHKTNKYKLFTIYKCESLFIDLLNYFVDEELDFRRDQVRQDLIPKEFDSFNECKITWLSYLYTCINCLFENSLEFTLIFAKLNGFKPYLKFLKNTNLILNISLNTLEGYLFHLTVLSKYSDTNRDEWRKLDAITTLLDIATHFSDENEIVDSVCIIIADISNDTEIDELQEINFVLDNFVQKLKAFDDFLLKHNELSTGYQQNLKGELTLNIIRPNPLTFILRGLNLLAINERVKLRLFNVYLIFDTLKRIIQKGFTLEKIGAIKLITRICFNVDLCQIILRDKEFINMVKKLVNKTDLNRDLYKASVDLDRIISDRFQKPPITLSHDIISQKRVKFYVTISHDRGRGNEIGKRLKNELEIIGYDVLMIENEVEHCLDKIWKLIEESYCVILLISESYRQSIGCQAEAQYSVRLSKPIVPVIIENGLDLDNGWVARLISSKKIIHFPNELFNDCVKFIEIEIRKIYISILENFKITDTNNN